MNITFYAGDSRNLIISVTDENNAAIDLTNASIKWVLINKDSTILSKTDKSGITINNSTTGQFTIAITAAETKNISGTYQHIARVTTSDGRSSIILTGTVTIQSSSI